MKTKMLFLLAVASAVCMWQSTAPFGNSAAGFASPLLLILIALHASTTRSAVLLVFVTQVPLWIWLHRWVADLAIPGWIGLGLYMSIWAPMFVYLLRRVLSNNIFPKVSIIFIAPVLWVGFECLRGIVIFDGYPWFLAGTGVVDSFYARIAAYGGVWAVSFFVVMVAAMFATLKQVKPHTWVIFTFFSLWLLLFGEYHSQIFRNPVQVAVIQTNVHQSNKVEWTWKQQQIDMAEIFRMTYDAVEQAVLKPQLIVWPETMLPGSGFEIGRNDYAPWSDEFLPLWYWSEELRLLAADIDIPFLVGSQTWPDVKVIEEIERIRVEPKEQFNSAVLVHTDGHTDRYDKIFLTPFGERIPYVEYWPWLQSWIRANFGAAMLFDLDKGGEPTRLTLSTYSKGGERKIRIGTPICYEDTIPSVVRDIVWDEEGKRQVDVLINLSNDGWFGAVDDTRLQHIQEARMRCIENQTPMIRAVNTGASCHISRCGDVRYAEKDGEIAMQAPSIFYTQINRNIERPLSASIGDSVAWISMFASILLVLGSFKKRSSSHDENTS